MKYNFDAAPDRRGTGNLKHDFIREFNKPESVIPMWVADMDFASPPCVSEALESAAKSGILGYADAKTDYYDAVASWLERRIGWRPEEDWLVKTPGVVLALNVAMRALIRPGDAVLIQPPVYHPFRLVTEKTGRRLVQSPLVLKNGRYEIDFEDFEEKIASENVKMFVLCSPHNPVGRVWTREELGRIGEICHRRGVTVVSDEIHCDIVLPGTDFVSFLTAAPQCRDETVVCTAPSKTFNVAGLFCSNIFIPNEDKRRLFREEMDAMSVGTPNALGLIAGKAAYLGGEEWLDELLAYLGGNLDYIRGFLKSELPEVGLIEPQGTYFAWLDFRGLGLDDGELDDRLMNRCGLWLDEGHMFGAEGSGFQRMVYACPKSTLEKAMERLKRIL